MVENPIETSQISAIRQKVFIKETPPGTYVFKDDLDHDLWGRTTGGEIYKDPESTSVKVTNILGIPNQTALWPYENVVNMGDNEQKERLVHRE